MLTHWYSTKNSQTKIDAKKQRKRNFHTLSNYYLRTKSMYNLINDMEPERVCKIDQKEGTTKDKFNAVQNHEAITIKTEVKCEFPSIVSWFMEWDALPSTFLFKIEFDSRTHKANALFCRLKTLENKRQNGALSNSQHVERCLYKFKYAIIILY